MNPICFNSIRFKYMKQAGFNYHTEWSGETRIEPVIVCYDLKSPTDNGLFTWIFDSVNIFVVEFVNTNFSCFNYNFFFDFEVISLRAVVDKSRISADPNFILTTRIIGGVVSRSSISTGCRIYDCTQLITALWFSIHHHKWR